MTATSSAPASMHDHRRQMQRGNVYAKSSKFLRKIYANLVLTTFKCLLSCFQEIVSFILIKIIAYGLICKIHGFRVQWGGDPQYSPHVTHSKSTSNWCSLYDANDEEAELPWKRNNGNFWFACPIWVAPPSLLCEQTASQELTLYELFASAELLHNIRIRNHRIVNCMLIKASNAHIISLCVVQPATPRNCEGWPSQIYLQEDAGEEGGAGGVILHKLTF